jgi:hypothetical protein
VAIEDGSGTASMCQPEESRRSANGVSRLSTPSWPTAMQACAALHETAASGRLSAGAAAAASDQSCPFQRSIRLAEPLVSWPTATQSWAARQLTESSAPRTRGVLITVQACPSQRSAIGKTGCPLAALEIWPTAMQAVRVAHESAASSQRLPGLASAADVQRPPCRCSAIDPNGALVPSARQSPAAPQETAASWVTLAGLGAACVVQPPTAASADADPPAASTTPVVSNARARRRASIAHIVGMAAAAGVGASGSARRPARPATRPARRCRGRPRGAPRRTHRRRARLAAAA